MEATGAVVSSGPNGGGLLSGSRVAVRRRAPVSGPVRPQGLCPAAAPSVRQEGARAGEPLRLEGTSSSVLRSGGWKHVTRSGHTPGGPPTASNTRRPSHGGLSRHAWDNWQDPELSPQGGRSALVFNSQGEMCVCIYSYVYIRVYVCLYTLPCSVYTCIYTCV